MTKCVKGWTNNSQLNDVNLTKDLLQIGLPGQAGQ